jgi:ACS family D-galactonate transporter-like MFS transporter
MNRRWVLLALIFTATVISYIDRGNLSIAAPTLMREFGLSPGIMGTLLSAFFWTYGAAQIPGHPA